MSLHNKSAIVKVLQAREERALLRAKLASEKQASISLTLNIAGYPKANAATKIVFDLILKDLKIILKANRIQSYFKNEINLIDEAGHFYVLGIANTMKTLTEIKSITENFEQNHPLNRLIDVDVFDANAEPISSGNKKKCIICEDKSAVDCMRNNTHSYMELRTFMFHKIESYIKNNRKAKIKRKLSDIAAKALLYEVSLSPKPGLVDFNSSGAHQDMNYYTFLHSSTAISQYWHEFAEAGINHTGILDHALPKIRKIGLQAEDAMFSATADVNTQKGLIFLLGLSVFTTAYLFKTENIFNQKRFIDSLKIICTNLIEKELENNTQNTISHGEITFKKYGEQGAGVRYEAQSGFPIVFNSALPFLEKALENKSFLDKKNTDKALKTCLIKIISILDDSNVLYRKGLMDAEQLKVYANSVLDGKHSYEDFCEHCKTNNISPGGSADMLALTLFFFFVKQELILE